MKHLQKQIPWILLGTILFVAFWIRIQGVPTIPSGQFTGNDPYLYYWQAQIVSENGRLPARDMHRWLPLGRDLGQSLNAYSYAIAYTHKVITLTFRNISLYQVALFTPVVCFLLGLGVLCFFLYRTFGMLFSSVVGVLLATLPGIVERSAAGFSDRDSWCLMLGILTVTTYLTSLQAQGPRSRLLWTLASGFTVFLGGVSWEGFGVFLSIILCVELWKFLTTDKEEGLGFYFLWVCTFVPTLTLCRLLLTFLVVVLFGLHRMLDIGLIATIALIFVLDAVDGYVARARNETSEIGEVVDTIADRIIENTFWIYWTATGSIPVWMPVAVMARGFLTDGLQRSFGYPKFGWAHALTRSRISRVLYGITKMLAFITLAAASSFEHPILEQGGLILAIIAVVYCLVRGLPFFFMIGRTP